jgi:hypothetical protein
MRLVLVVIALFVAGAVVVGCGSDNKSSDNTSASTPTTDTGGDTSTDTSGGSGGGNADNPQVKQAIEACKQQIDAQPGLDASLKGDLKKICEKAATGDQQAVRDASKQVCTKIVEANVPSGPARDQALQACDQAGATP